MTFSAGFGGNRIFYTAARSATQNSDWQALGTWKVPGSAVTGPGVGAVTPTRSSSAGQTYSFTFTDTNGWSDQAVVDVLANNFLNGTGARYFAFAPPSGNGGELYLLNDAGNGYVGGGSVSLGVGSYARQRPVHDQYRGKFDLDAGNTLTLNLPITFSAGFAGNQIFYMAARNSGAGNSGWQAVGSVTIP